VKATREEYAEFRITFDPDPERRKGSPQYRTLAVGPDGSAMQGLFVDPLSPWMIDAAQSSIAAAGRSVQRSMPSTSMDPVRDLGARLYDALFQGSVERAFGRTLQTEGAVRLRLEFDDPDLAAIPWEFLYDRRRNDFLVLSTRTPLVRSVARAPRFPAKVLDAPVRILAVASDLTGTRQVDEEIGILHRTLSSSTGTVELTTRGTATWRDFHEAILSSEPHVVHLIATGMSGRQAVAFRTDAAGSAAPEESYSLHDAAEFGRLLADRPQLCLVVINGCRTDGLAAGLAPLLPAVVGHRGEISDDGVLAFTEGVYRALSGGLPLDAAVTDARLRVDSRSPGGREWCAPVLYQQAASIAFPAARREVLARAPRLDEVAPAPGATTSGNDRTLHRLRSLLAIHQANLDALVERAGRFDNSPPDYLEHELETTRSEIARLHKEIAAQKPEPS
jgi:hypothetical protein